MRPMLKTYFEECFAKIEGWVLPAALSGLAAVDELSEEAGVKGGACEIGVHHGRFFLALLACVGSSYKSLAVDVFEDQHLNIDHSGKGSLEKFLENVETYASENDKVEVLKTDSLSISVNEVLELKRRFANRFRLFSIDGGHTSVHALNDLLVSQEMIANGGIVIVDDFFQPDWPGVTEGVFRYYQCHNAKLAPILFAGHKLFLTSFGFHKPYCEKIEAKMLTGRGQSFLKKIDMFGHTAYSFRLHPNDPVIR